MSNNRTTVVILVVNWAIDDKQEMIDLIETVYRGARKGRGLVIATKDYSTKYKY
jgi:U5 snRNP protein, DIM1 family